MPISYTDSWANTSDSNMPHMYISILSVPIAQNCMHITLYTLLRIKFKSNKVAIAWIWLG